MKKLDKIKKLGFEILNTSEINIITDNMKSADKLNSFIKYCVAHPELRFWQALCAWSEQYKILRMPNELETYDTFYE